MFRTSLIGALVATLAFWPVVVRADDLDLLQTAVPPNVMILFDSSGSMNTSLPAGGTRLSAAKDAMTMLVDDVNPDDGSALGYDENVRFGIARFNGDTGGHILVPVDGTKSQVMSAISGISAGGFTPLSEAYLDISRYMAGSYGFGDFSVLSNMPGTSSSYNDPIDAECRQSFVVVMTDGIPRLDNNPTWRSVMEGVATGAADTDGDEPTWPAGPQSCPTSDTDVPPVLDGDCDRAGWLDDISKYAYETDIVPDTTMSGVQNLVTYTVGFTIDQDLLEDAADSTHGRGAYFTTNTSSGLAQQMGAILSDIIERSTSLTAATVPSSRTAFGDGFYTAFFVPSNTDAFWPGHLQAFRLSPSLEILDDDGDPAIDPVTSQFVEPREPFWDVADRLLDPMHPARTIYSTDFSSGQSRTDFLSISDSGTPPSALASALNISASDPAGYPDDPATSSPFATENDLAIAVRDYLKGEDTFDADADADTTETRDAVLGDIFHSSPIAIGPPPVGLLQEEGFGPLDDPLSFVNLYKHRDRVLYFGANDGMLHAVDGGSYQLGDNILTPEVEYEYYNMGTGDELWAWIPGQLLDDVKQVPINLPRTSYFVDGSPNAADVWLPSSSTDVTKEPGEWATVLITGLREGGQGYMALNVTDPTDASYPELLWEAHNDPADSSPLASVEFGETWSEPIITRVKMEGTSGMGDVCGDNDGDGDCRERWVMIVGGGYQAEADPNNSAWVGSESDPGWTANGRGVYMIAVDTGEVLAQLKYDSSDPTFSDMLYALPSTPGVLDLDFDGFADVVYIGDLGGQVWKWDISGVGSDGDSDGLVDPTVWPAGVHFRSAPASMTAGGYHYHSIYFSPVATYIDSELWLAFASGERQDVNYLGVAGDDDNNRVWVINDQNPIGSNAFDYVVEEGNTTVLGDLRGLSLLAGTDTEDTVGGDDGYYMVVPDGEKFITNHLIFGGLFLTLAYAPDPTASICAGSGEVIFYVFQISDGSGVIDSADASARSVSVGNGAPTDPRVTISDSGVALIGQTSTGEVIQLPVPVDPPDRVKRVYWRQRF